MNVLSIIQSALSKGIPARSILNHLMRVSPQNSDRIRSALAMGYTAETVLKMLSGIKGYRDDEPKEFLTESEKARRTDKERKKEVYKNLAMVGGGLASAAMLARAAPMMQAGAEAVMSSRLPPTSPVSPPSPHQQLGLPQSPEQQIAPSPEPSPSPIQPPSTPQQQPLPSSPIQPQVPISPSPTSAIDILKMFGQDQRVLNMLKSGNNPEQIAVLLQKLMGKEGGKQLAQMVETGQSKPLIDLIDEVSSEQQKIETPQIEESIEEPKQKGSMVMTPDGIGTITSISGDNALVEIDGKQKKVHIDQAISSPIPEKGLADLYSDLVQGIEKETDEEISRMVDFAGYDPEKNQLAFLPHSGGLYIYDDISPEESSLLRDVLSTRKTTGENFIGAWKQGSKSPIGAAMSQLILKLQKQRGGKGSEYSGKFQTVYRAFEPAIKAAMKKKKEQSKKRKKP